MDKLASAAQRRLSPSPVGGVPGPVQQTDLRFNPQIAEQFRNLDRQMVSGQAQALGNLNDLGLGRSRAVADQGRMADAARRALSQRMSDQGILRSGINVGARSDINTENISAIDNLNQQYNQGVSGVNTGLADFFNNLNSQRESLRMSQARSEIETRLQEEMRRASAASQLQYALGLQNGLY